MMRAPLGLAGTLGNTRPATDEPLPFAPPVVLAGTGPEAVPGAPVLEDATRGKTPRALAVAAVACCWPLALPAPPVTVDGPEALDAAPETADWLDALGTVAASTDGLDAVGALAPFAAPGPPGGLADAAVVEPLDWGEGPSSELGPVLFANAGGRDELETVTAGGSGPRASGA
ncbi:MAG TPA: hypothetical protein VK066_21840 [Chloroflexota bacterium]|nr:hypothetical protein [Chloroflexota bacterium]